MTEARRAPDSAASPRFLPAGESALVVEFGRSIEPRIHDCVLALDAAVATAAIDGVIETVPTYRSLMVHFDPRRLAQEALLTRLEALLQQDASAPRAARRWAVPVCYDGPCAEDLVEVAERLGLTPDRVVELHAAPIFRLYMYGFAPGFAYLGGLPPELAIPRRRAPRPPVPTGSVLIAGGQALLSTFSMPTGWYMIGRTPERLFDLAREPAFLFQIGDELVIERIDQAAFDRLAAEVERGRPVVRQVA